jgi:multiple sugar transport system substrate-binding protein
MKAKWGLLAVTVLLVMLTASACGSGATGEAKPGSGTAAGSGTVTGLDKPHEPVSLTAYRYNGGYTPEEFDMYFADPVKKKFPYIDLKYIVSGPGKTYQELLATGDFPDIVLGGARSVSDLLIADIPLDLRDLAKKNNLDWNLYDPAAMEMLKMLGPNGEVFGLPAWLNYYVTFYNKDIFDHFGAPYPKDNMTWDEMTALAARVTRLDNGIQYKGIRPGTISLMARGMSLDYFEPGTDKVKVTTDAWGKVFDLGRKIYTIEGNLPKGEQLASGPLFTSFVKNKDIAIMPTYGNALTQMADPKLNNGVNWDMASYPSYQEAKGISAEADGNMFVVSKASKHQEDAFQVVKYMSTDPTQQLELAKRAASLPVITLKQTQEVFGEAFPVLKSKNTKAVFSVKLGKIHPFNKYENVARKVVDQTFVKWIETSEDRVSILRKIEEQANKDVQDAK